MSHAARCVCVVSFCLTLFHFVARGGVSVRNIGSLCFDLFHFAARGRVGQRETTGNRITHTRAATCDNVGQRATTWNNVRTHTRQHRGAWRWPSFWDALCHVGPSWARGPHVGLRWARRAVTASLGSRGTTCYHVRVVLHTLGRDHWSLCRSVGYFPQLCTNPEPNGPRWATLDHDGKF